jgi:hypothetical protein
MNCPVVGILVNRVHVSSRNSTLVPIRAPGGTTIDIPRAIWHGICMVSIAPSALGVTRVR